MDRDERETIKIMEFVQDRQNPFDLEKVPDELINITSGQVASQKVAKDLSSFLEDGEKLNANFIDERLKSDRPKSFWDPEKRQKFATFTDMIACIATSKSKKLQMDSDVLFRRLLAVSKQRDVSLENVMRHELAAVPPSLFYDDGAMRKTTKADLAKKLESVVEVMQELSDTTEKSAYIIDGMAMLQSLHDPAFQTFRDLKLGKKVFSEKFIVPVAIETIGSPDGDERSKLQRWRVEP
ncbi:Protein cft1 [Dissostichus eleginoides]|uniref:Protein cft1 n=1 Tax=Dissostichus eleginoides TaxID=100907 RepID=A0AAD9BYJ0_DISEL|nr:Protein cft1 [Dissostichus eleginoides]